METWLLCWNCEHETPQERMHYEIFYRVQGIFSKKLDGTVKDKYFIGFDASHAFYKCTKCSAPNYYVHEYRPPKYFPESSHHEYMSDFRNSIRDKGVWDEERLFNIYHYPSFGGSAVPEWTNELPEELMKLLWEIYAAKKKGLNTLCAMGIRAVIEVFAVSKLGDIGGFAKKLAKLRASGHVSDAQYNILSIITEAGNAAAHRGFSPTSDQVGACLEVLEAIFFFEIKNNELRGLEAATPKRKV